MGGVHLVAVTLGNQIGRNKLVARHQKVVIGKWDGENRYLLRGLIIYEGHGVHVN